jgi:hypothetical protein
VSAREHDALEGRGRQVLQHNGSGNEPRDKTQQARKSVCRLCMDDGFTLNMQRSMVVSASALPTIQVKSLRTGGSCGRARSALRCLCAARICVV